MKRASILNKTLIIIAAAALLLSATDPLPQPNAELAVSASFLRKLSKLPIQRTEDLDTTLNRTRIITRINVNGNAHLAPWQTGKNGLGFCINASNAIHSDMDATISAPGQIFVHSDAEANTNTSSNKCFFLNEAGLTAHPAATSAKTKLTVKNLDVWAGGLFRRIKERLGRNAAERAMAKQIPENEREISERAVKTINDLFNQLTTPMVKTANEAWQNWVRDATLRTKLIPIPPRFLSTKGAVYVMVPSADGANQLELKPEGDEALLINVKPQYIRDIAKTYLADFTMSDMELLHLILNPSGDYATPEDVIGSPEDIVVQFTGETPVDMTMQDQVITLIANFRSVETLGSVYENLSLRAPVKVDVTDNGVAITLPDRLDVVDTATGQIRADLSEIFTKRWSMVVTGKRQYNLEEIRKDYAPWLPLRLTKADASNNNLRITAINGPDAEFEAINKKIADMIGIK